MSDPINIYLLRGLTRESGHWGSFVGQLQQHIPTAKIFLLDLPGAGKHVHEKASFSIKRMVDFMRKEILHGLQNNPGRNIICATSLGGMLASEWVIRYKKDFQGLVIINASFKTICKSSERVQPSVRWDMLKILLTNNVEKREALIIKVNSNKPSQYKSLTQEWVDIQNKRRMSRINILKQSFAGVLYGVKGKKPEVPLLIIGSKGDRMVCPECISKIHRAFGGTLVWHPDAGHGLPIDDPLWLSQNIANWYHYKFMKEIDDLPKI